MILRHGELTRKVFPNKYGKLKVYVKNEYSLYMTQEEHARIIYNIINTNRKKTELSLNRMEKGKIRKSGQAGHRMKKCCYSDPNMR